VVDLPSNASVYDVATNTWTSIAPMPVGRCYAACGTDGRKLYVFGGSTGAVVPGPDSNDVQIYDPLTDTWVWSGAANSTLAPLPRKRGGTGEAVYYRDEFYVIGGETTDMSAGGNTAGMYSRMAVYDPVMNTWRLEAA
jgi:N-acetylneuraminic acid mutarotase